MSTTNNISGFTDSVFLLDEDPYWIFKENDYTSSSFFSRIKSTPHTVAVATKDFIKDLYKKIYDFFNKPETKLAALFSYWATEAVVTLASMYAFLTLGMWPAAGFSFAIFAYLTYATFGVIGEVKS